MDGYVRVSRRMGRDGSGYISPAVQREAIQRWPDYRGVEITAWHVDEDESGGTQDRPGCRSAWRASSDTDGVACWRLNRFARNVGGAIADVERIQVAGGVLAFVEEDIDPTGPFGSFILTVLLAVATLERDNMVAGWKTAKERATERGAKIGPTPFGYQRTDEQARYGDLLNVDAHAPLVSHATFEAAQPEPSTRRRPKATFPLSGLARCASCNSPLVGARGGADNRRMSRCSAALTTHKGQRCTAPAAVSAALLEELTRDALLDSLHEHPGFAGYGDVVVPGLDDQVRGAEVSVHEVVADVYASLSSSAAPGGDRRSRAVGKATPCSGPSASSPKTGEPTWVGRHLDIGVKPPWL